MLKNYIKIAFKVLLRRKFFTFISLFGISFTLVVLMVVTAVFDHIFGVRPPETHQDRTLGIYSMHFSGEDGNYYGPGGYEFFTKFIDLKSMPRTEYVTVSSFFIPVMAYYNGIRHSIFTRKTDADYWKILDYTYLEGGPITEEDVAKANFVAVINETTKKKFFGDSPAYGKMITVDNQRFRIAGVVEDVPIVRVLSFSDVWVPLTTEKTDDYLHDGLTGFYIGAMLAESRDDIPAIKEEFKMRLARMEMPNPERLDKAHGVPETLFETFSRMITLSIETDESKTGTVISVIIGMMIFFMILPTVNLININMSRILERSSEIGVRKAFGASSRRLIMQFIVENLILTLIGGVFGLIISEVVLNILNGSGLIPYSNFSLNLRIFFYGMVITVFFGVFSGVYPAWKMSRLHPVEALKEGA